MGITGTGLYGWDSRISGFQEYTIRITGFSECNYMTKIGIARLTKWIYV